MAQVFSPLDEELGLLPGEYTPQAMERLVRLSAWMPFGQAVKTLQGLLRVQVSKSSAVRMSQAAGAAYVACQADEVAELERKAPEAPAGAEQAMVSADGAMVPLLRGQWGEVKTLVMGEVAQSDQGKSRSQHLSYFSRLASAEAFTRLALVETHRRGLENSSQVGAVMDGAEWLQGFIDHHCPQAVRILDFAHVAQRVHAIAQAVWGEGEEAETWTQTWLEQLKTHGPQPLLQAVRLLVKEHPAQAQLPTHLAYLEKRQAQLDYPAFLKAGWPIGSGSVESANKLVVEARLKGAGMHWQRNHVDPMLALRNIVCNDRWDEAWPHIECRLRTQARQLRLHQQKARRLVRQQKAAATKPATLPQRSTASTSPTLTSPPTPPPPKLSPPHKPAPDHPWRRFRFGRNLYAHNSHADS